MDQRIILDNNKSALDYHISNVGHINELCDPLKYLGITTFGYMKMLDDSTYLHLCNQDNWSRYYIQNVHDSGEVFSKRLAIVDIEITTFVWPNETKDRLLLDLKDNNIFHGFTFYKRADNYIEHWNFCTNPNNTQVYDLYYKHNELLWKFVTYFCDNANDLIDHTDTRKLAKYKNGNSIAPEKSKLGKESINKFLQGIETKQYLLKNKQTWAFISVREKQCLQLVSEGLAQEEISQQVGISPNRVEHYLNESRRSLYANSMNELLVAFENSPHYLEKS